MVHRTSHRLFKALRSLFSLRNFIMVTMVTVTLWLFPLPRWKDLRRVVQLIDKTASICVNGSSSTACSPSFSPSPPAVVQNTSSPDTSSLLVLTTPKLVAGFLSQKSQMVGTGQGNLMFMYASMLGIADHAQMVPHYPVDGPLKKIFAITTKALDPTNSISVDERKACSFDANLFSMSNRRSNVTIVGYLQSWKYFNDIKDRILREFTFQDELRVQAIEFFRNISLHNRTVVSDSKNDMLYIGVHIRRGDMIASYNTARGYTVATKEYLAVAVNHFRTDFPASTFVFVVCSDDLDWSKKNFPMVDRNSLVIFSEGRTADGDMAILSACNHTIMTVGTFGWWAAYLAGGRTIYYKNFPSPSTHIAGLLTKEDYFPPQWIGL